VIEGDQGKGWIQVVTLNNNMGSSSFIEQEKTQTFDLDFSKNPETKLLITGVNIIKEKIEGQEKERRLYYTCIPSLILQGSSELKDGKILEISWDFACTAPFKKENAVFKCTYKHS